MKLHHIQLAIPQGSEEKCRKFYGSILGMQEIEKPKTLQSRGGIWFQVSDLELHLGVEENFNPAKKAHPAFLSENTDSMAKKLESENYEVLWDTNIPEQKRFFTHDPVGNRIEFLEII